MKSWKQIKNTLQQAARNLESIDREIAMHRVQIDELERIKAVLVELPKRNDLAEPKNVGGDALRGKSREEIKAEIKLLHETVLRAVATMGPSRPRQIAEKCDLPANKIERALRYSGWFQNEVDGWHLTADGQLAWNELRESQLEAAS